MSKLGKDLLSGNALAVSPEAEKAQTAEILAATQSSETIANMREMIDQKKKELAILVDVKNLESTQKLADKLSKLDEILFSDEVLDRVGKNISSAYDYNMFAKARKELHDLMMKQQLQTADPDKAKEQPNIKIGLLFGNGNIALAVETGGGNGG